MTGMMDTGFSTPSWRWLVFHKWLVWYRLDTHGVTQTYRRAGMLVLWIIFSTPSTGLRSHLLIFVYSSFSHLFLFIESSHRQLLFIPVMIFFLFIPVETILFIPVSQFNCLYITPVPPWRWAFGGAVNRCWAIPTPFTTVSSGGAWEACGSFTSGLLLKVWA